MDALNDLVTDGLVALFGAEGVALGMAALIAVAGAGILAWVGLARVRPLMAAINGRNWELWGGLRGVPPSDEPAEVERIMSRRGPRSAPLLRGWTEYARTLHGEPGRRWSTARAAPFFEGAAAAVGVLGWWANLFVAIGLVFTFLGVVAALSKATTVIGGGDPAAAQAALAELLRITATKFWTSIAGVTVSIVLRVFERRWRVRILNAIDDMAGHLEAAAPPMSHTDLLARQLALLERQTAAMETAAQGDRPRASPRRLSVAEQ